MIIFLIVLASIYLFGVIFVVTAASMHLGDESALKRQEALNQLKRAPLWPLDEVRRLKAENELSKHQANIEQSRRLLEQLDRVEREQRRNLQTWEKAAQSHEKLRELTRRDDNA